MADQYQNQARYYDLIYSTWKDYKKESDIIKKLIKEHKKTNGKELLDIACGTGMHLQYFKRDFKCMGVDYSKSMLKEAKKRLKNVPLKHGDMTNLKLNKKFDIITCLFSAIGHCKTKAQLENTIKGFYDHLKPGGIVIFESWFEPKEFGKGRPHMTTYEDKDLKIARLTVSDKKNKLSILDMHYVIAERNKKVFSFIDKLRLGMFTKQETLKIMKECGFKTKYIKKGILEGTHYRPLYIGLKE